MIANMGAPPEGDQMQSSAATVSAYLKSLPEDRRKALTAIRAVMKKNMPKGYVEAMTWGMITFEVPLKTAPDTYNGKPLMYAGLASQKNHMAIYICALNCVPGAEKSFAAAWKKTGRKLDMGKSCLRFKILEDLDLGLIAKAIAAVPLAKFVENSKTR
jgi:uncharacterized protein YdhG (YjbR/CyaY superfamily)